MPTVTPKKITGPDQPRGHRNLLPAIVKIAACFILLEPIWMLLPFAGFLYGSVMHLEALASNPRTALLAYFVFPTHTLFPLGLILILTGLLLFLAGAFQIYHGKLAQKGLITTGIYRWFRHPQYLALTIFGLGIILTWGRLLTFIAFFVMLWLYYLLAKREEQNCRKLFGTEYDAYRAATCLLFPGEELILAIIPRLPTKNMPTGTSVLVSFLLVTGIAITTGVLIIKGNIATRNTLPLVRGDYPLADHSSAGIPLLMVKGPALQAAPSQGRRDAFMAKSFAMLLGSPKINEVLNKAGLDQNSTLLAFLIPGRNWYRKSRLNLEQAEVTAFIFCVKSQVNFTGNNFQEFRRHWQITELIRVEGMVYGRMAAGLDPVAGEINREPFQERMEERIDFFLSGL